FVLAASGNDLSATVNGMETTYPGVLDPASGVVRIEVDAGAGDDTLTVDSTNPIALPISYDGGTGKNSLILAHGTATTDTYTPGPALGSGTSVMTFGAVTQTVHFMNLAPVTDLVPGPLTVNGTNGNDAIADRPPTDPAHQGLISVNDQETIEFANKTSLTI